MLARRLSWCCGGFVTGGVVVVVLVDVVVVDEGGVVVVVVVDVVVVVLLVVVHGVVVVVVGFVVVVCSPLGSGERQPGRSFGHHAAAHTRPSPEAAASGPAPDSPTTVNTAPAARTPM